jgi:hypothetical protein
MAQNLVNWDDDIKSLLKKMKGRGEKAFTVFERQVCFYTAFHDGKPNQEKIHRTHKEIKKDYQYFHFVLLQIVQVLPKLALRVVQQRLLVLCCLVASSVFYPVNVETAPSVYFHMYVKNNTGYLYRLIQESLVQLQRFSGIYQFSMQFFKIQCNLSYRC